MKRFVNVFVKRSDVFVNVCDRMRARVRACAVLVCGVCVCVCEGVLVCCDAARERACTCVCGHARAPLWLVWVGVHA